MSDGHVLERLSEFIDGRLGPAESDRVRAHLAECERCRGEHEALLATVRAVRALGLREAPAGFRVRVMERVQAAAAAPHVAAPRRRPGWLGRLGWIAAAAAVLMAVGLAVEGLPGRGVPLIGQGGGTVAVGEPQAVRGLGVPTGQDAMMGAQPPEAGAPPQQGEPLGAPPAGGAVTDGGGKDSVSTLGAPGVPPSPQGGRKIVRSAEYRVEVDDVRAAAQAVQRTAETLGGYVQEAALDADGAAGSRSHARLVLRVPTESLDRLADRLGELGTVMYGRVWSNDVTAAYVDTESRVRNLKAEEQRLLEILSQARGVEELLRVENEIWRIRGEIEMLEGQLRNWDRLVELATASVELVPRGSALLPSPPGVGGRLIRALQRGLEAALAGVEAMLVGAGFLLPWALVGGAGWMVFRRLGGRGTGAAG